MVAVALVVILFFNSTSVLAIASFSLEAWMYCWRRSDEICLIWGKMVTEAELLNSVATSICSSLVSSSSSKTILSYV